MASYSDYYKDQEHKLFLGRWAPGALPPLTESNLRYNIARANAAEDELRRLKAALRTIKEAVK